MDELLQIQLADMWLILILLFFFRCIYHCCSYWCCCGVPVVHIDRVRRSKMQQEREENSQLKATSSPYFSTSVNCVKPYSTFLPSSPTGAISPLPGHREPIPTVHRELSCAINYVPSTATPTVPLSGRISNTLPRRGEDCTVSTTRKFVVMATKHPRKFFPVVSKKKKHNQ